MVDLDVRKGLIIEHVDVGSFLVPSAHLLHFGLYIHAWTQPDFLRQSVKTLAVVATPGLELTTEL